ncbi:MAG TPA: kynureninase [Steroidobacteraceae bacterium]|nr:kynureninase [Steroidobacteraceae bacterium]
MNNHFSTERGFATQLDNSDPLALFRKQFHIPVRNGVEQTYLCGHSLGLQPKRTAELINEELTQWQRRAVDGHFEGPRPWLSYHELLTPGLSELTGAQAPEVVAMNSLSVNLHLMLISFYQPTKQRYKIVIEDSAFPSDRYAVTSQIRLHGFDPTAALITIKPRDGEDTIRTEDILSLLQSEGLSIATVMLPGVQYLTGQAFDMKAIAAAAHAQGCSVGFDLAHAIGNIPLHLHDWNVDFAIWCSYKYLNSGPGSIGGCFVHQRHATENLPRLAGWWGHDKASRFEMPAEFSPIAGAEGWQLSNPPIFACTPLLASLDVFRQAGMHQLRDKSLQLTGYLRFLLQSWLGGEISIITPQQNDAHGCQLSLRLNTTVDRARNIHQQLLSREFVTDWREPNIIRIAPVPLYNCYDDVWRVANALREIMQ